MLSLSYDNSLVAPAEPVPSIQGLCQSATNLSHYPLLLYYRLTCFPHNPVSFMRSCLSTPLLAVPLNKSPVSSSKSYCFLTSISPEKPFKYPCYTSYCLNSEPVISHQVVTHSHPISSLVSHGWAFQKGPNTGQDTEHCQPVFLLKTWIPSQKVGEEQLKPCPNC